MPPSKTTISTESVERHADFAEKLLDAKLTLIQEKIGHLTDAVQSMGGDLRKILDDHEQRLRKQAEVDSQQGSQMARLEVQLVEIGGRLKALEVGYESVKRGELANAQQSLSFWQRVAMEALKLAAFGGGAAGISSIILKVIS